MTVYEILLDAFSPTIQAFTTIAIGWAAAKAAKFFTIWINKIHNDQVRNFVKDNVWAIAQTGKKTLTGPEMKQAVMQLTKQKFPNFPVSLTEVFLESAVTGLKILKSPEPPAFSISSPVIGATDVGP